MWFVVIVQNFGTKFLLRRGECKTPENSIFFKNSKTVILVKIQKNFYISDDETDFTVGIVSRNLATTSNSETVGISHFSRHWVSGAVKRLVRDI